MQTRGVVVLGVPVPLPVAIALAILLAGVSAAAADQTVTVRSGNSPVGTQDALVRVLRYGRTGDITPTAADFVTVQTAPFAYVVSLGCGCYIPQLPSDPSAKWLATTPSWTPESALYAIPFQLTDATIAGASLDLHFSVDNAVNGVYINGLKISGSSYDGDYHAEYRFVRNDIAPLLVPGATNWIYINASDYGVIASLIFSATISTTGGHTTGIVPVSGGNAASVTTVITGSGFAVGSHVSLVGIGNDIEATDVTVKSSNEIVATFNLVGAGPGVRSVIVTREGSTPLSLPDAFTIVEGGAAQLAVSLIGPGHVRAGRESTFQVVVTNSGLVDAERASLQLGMPSTGGATSVQALAAASAFGSPFFFGNVPAQGQIQVPITLPPQSGGCVSVAVHLRQRDDDCNAIAFQRNAIRAYLEILYVARLANLELLLNSYLYPTGNPVCLNPTNGFAIGICATLKFVDSTLEAAIKQAEQGEDFLKAKAAAHGCPQDELELSDIFNLGTLADVVKAEIDHLEQLLILNHVPRSDPQVQQIYIDLDVFKTQALSLPTNVSFDRLPVSSDPPSDIDGSSRRPPRFE